MTTDSTSDLPPESPPTSTSPDKREEPRLRRQERAYIRVLLNDGAAVSTQTEDISCNGFRVVLANPLVVGSVLHVVIELQASHLRFLLAAEVRWCRAMDGDAHQAGFALLDARDTDYQAWQRFAAANSERPR